MRAFDALRGIAPKAAGMVVAYGFTSVATILAIFILRARADPQDFKFFLGFLFVSTIASGLDPGTSKAALMGDHHAAGTGDTVLISLMKAAVASIAMGLLWKTVDGAAPLSTLVWALPITAAGFISTDYRVSLDWRGRHQQAIWLKQGSLGIGVIGAATALLLEGGVTQALLWSTVARFAWTAAFLRLSDTTGDPAPGALRQRLGRQLLDRRWMNIFLMSVVSALSGSMDRIVVLRLLPATISGDYFLWYELLSKFWLLPYVAGPVIFARRLKGDGARALLIGMTALTLGGGLALLAGLPMGVALLGDFLPHPFNTVTLPLLMFVAGIVLSALAQVFGSDLTGRGRLGYMLFALITVMVASPLIFGAGAVMFGIVGIYGGWLVKSLLELALYSLPYLAARRSRPKA